MFNTLDIRHQLLFFQPTKGAPASISPTTAADPSHSFRMTINVSCHSEWTQECCVKKKGKRDGDTEWRIYYFDDALPLSLITVTDPSHSFRMTINISLIMTSCRPPSFSTFSWQLTAHSSQLIAFIFLPLFPPWVQIFHTILADTLPWVSLLLKNEKGAGTISSACSFLTKSCLFLGSESCYLCL